MKIVALILDLVCTFNEIFWLYQWVNIFLEKKNFVKRENQICKQEVIICILYTFLVFSLNRITLTSAYTMIIIMIANLVSVLCIWKSNLMQGIAIVGGYFFGLFLEGNIVISITGIIGGKSLIQKTTGELGVERIVYVSLGCIVWFILNYSLTMMCRKKNIKLKQTLSIAGISIAGFLGSAFIGTMLVNSFSIQISKIWYAFTILVLVVVFVCYFLIRQKENKMLMTILSAQNEMLERNYTQVNEFYTSNAKLYHDMNHHFDVLYHLLQQGNQNQAISYISDLRASNSDMSMNIQSGINVLDAILCEMEKKAQKKGIELRVEIPILPCDFGMENGDMCSLFANLLENAIEAAIKNVTMKIKYYNQTMYITIKNDYLLQPIRRNGDFITQKKEKELHGWGTQIIKQIVQKYEGSMEYEIENDIFTVYIVINEKV